MRRSLLKHRAQRCALYKTRTGKHDAARTKLSAANALATRRRDRAELELELELDSDLHLHFGLDLDLDLDLDSLGRDGLALESRVT